MRGPAVAPLVAVSVTCCPTIGFKLLSIAYRNASTARRNGVPAWFGGKAFAFAPGGGERVRLAEGEGRSEAHGRVDRARVEQSEAADLIPLKPAETGDGLEDRLGSELFELGFRKPEHTDLRVQVAQVGNLEHGAR